MHVEERPSNGGGAGCSLFVPCEKSAVFNGHSFGIGGENADGNLGAFSVEEFRTYKRRKHSRLSSQRNLQENLRVSVAAGGQLAEQKLKQPQDIVLHSNSYEQSDLSRLDGPLLLEGSDACLHGHWRNVVLEHISQSFDVMDGGIQSCIRDAVASSQFCSTNTFKMHGASEQITQVQESVQCHEDGRKWNSQLQREPKISERSLNAAKEHRGVTSDGSQNKLNNHADVHFITERCQRVFHDVVVSEKFALLCKLLCENFQGINVESFSEFSVINSRMKEGAYGQSPKLFYRDIQQVWRKFQKIGNEMVHLAKSLSDISRTSFLEQVGGSVNGICGEGKHEEINQIGPEKKDCFGFVTTKQLRSLESDWHTKLEQAEFCGLDKVCTCRRCGDKADGKDCLVCDSCEGMYHVSCIEPAVEEIPLKNWYCANCTASGIESPHENCVVCERLNDPRTQTHRGEDQIEPMAKEMLSDLEEKSDCSMEAKDQLQSSSVRGTLRCRLCGSGEEDGQKSRICGHPVCPNKYYHVRCLTSQQLKSYGPCWYCPSCLCRACLRDQDDEKIVLCDGCDHAYHIYCMEPPRSSIPRGKWFCSQCETGIRVIHKAKRTYENLEKQQKKNSSGGANRVDMLLSAAEKLKSEEKAVIESRKREPKEKVKTEKKIPH